MCLSVFHKSAGLTAALLLTLAIPGSAQRSVLPAGTVITVKTTAALQSSTMKQGDIFETVIEEDVVADEAVVIPAGSRVRGVVAMAAKATRQESGVLDIVFDRLMHTDGTTYAIQGKLTSTDTVERRQIDANPNQRVVLVGGRGGIGAAIAGAGASSNRNNILGALGALLSEGMDVNVAAGTPLAVELERALTLRGRGRVVAYSGGTIYTAADLVREAQTALARLGYYRGAANGTLTDPTRRALFEFQVDRGLPATGNLDGRTARALGLDVTTLTGAVLTAEQATALRRDAQAIVARHRAELGASSVGRLDPNRGYSQPDLELWFALSAFADNASLYEQVVRGTTNPDGTILAGKALLAAARRVETAFPTARTSIALQNAWNSTRRNLSPLEQ